MVKRPKLIVFDLDYTLWPFYVDSYVTPPFHKKDNDIIDSNGRSVKCYPEVPEVLQMLHRELYLIGIASRTREIKGANQLIKLFGWNKFIAYKEIYPGCKVAHFYSLKDKSGLDLCDMMFFDDEDSNINDVSKRGVLSILVTHGINMKLVKDGLEAFSNRSDE